MKGKGGLRKPDAASGDEPVSLSSGHASKGGSVSPTAGRAPGTRMRLTSGQEMMPGSLTGNGTGPFLPLPPGERGGPRHRGHGGSGETNRPASVASGGADERLQERVTVGLKSEARLRSHLNRLHDLNLLLVRRIEQRIASERELKESSDRLRLLAGHLQKLREQEKTSFMRELQGDIGQSLTAIKMGLSWIEKKLPADAERLMAKTRSLLEDLDRTISAVQRISTALRPSVLDDFGLGDALRLGARDFEKRTHLPCRLKVEPENLRLDRAIAIEVFRIFHEGLNNVTKHAAAKEVYVSVKKRQGELTMEMKDDGRGIPARKVTDRNSFGLAGMRERACLMGGEFSISGIKGKGTTILVRVPLAGSM